LPFSRSFALKSAISLIKGARVWAVACVLNKNAVAPPTACYVILLFIVHKMLLKFHLALKESNFALEK
jgi:hypothetical protein